MTRKTLKSGFTTGTAAAAAVKGALCLLSENRVRDVVRIPFLSEGFVDIAVKRCEKISDTKALCTVLKDGGDDPDATHGAEIGAVVTLDKATAAMFRIRGGKGVGRVTRPGLGLEINGPAINPGPVRMIRMAAEEILGQDLQGLDIEIFVEKGEQLAEKTLNRRLGILGGISILGTTGIVRPMSHEAYIATIVSSLSVAASSGLDHVVLTTGRRSERFAMGLFPGFPEEAFIQIGDFFKASLEASAKAGIKHVTVAVFFGKAVKMAQGAAHTHASKSDVSLDRLAGWVRELSADAQLAEKVKTANTARHAFDLVHRACPELIIKVGREMKSSAELFAGKTVAIHCLIFDFEGTVIYDSAHSEVIP